MNHLANMQRIMKVFIILQEAIEGLILFFSSFFCVFQKNYNFLSACKRQH